MTGLYLWLIRMIYANAFAYIQSTILLEQSST